ncbi:MAG: hypothetical protein K2M40_03110 [Muribaculaceae bacterium]|nr:hypothetical protein [Muribaculaceae bacterium]MDE6819021.1 hypothetical protein [Muribaculaceae bacterium]
MKQLKVLAIAAAALVGLASCKTTEANYRAAYEATKSAQAAADADDGLDDNTRRLLAKNSNYRTATYVVGSDTLAVSVLFVKLDDGQAVEQLPQFSVVANAFSQVFNARALCSRLKEAGFENAYIFHTATPDYYVAAGGSDDISDIPAIMQALAKAGNPGSRAGFPAIIRNGFYRPQTSR